MVGVVYIFARGKAFRSMPLSRTITGRNHHRRYQWRTGKVVSKGVFPPTTPNDKDSAFDAIWFGHQPHVSSKINFSRSSSNNQPGTLMGYSPEKQAVQCPLRCGFKFSPMACFM